MSLLEEMVAQLTAMPEKERAELIAEISRATGSMKWTPNPGPQTDAYYSQADVLLYGGSGGSGKTSLLTGLALTSHQRSLILRRQYTDLGALTEDLIRFNGTRQGFNGSTPPSLRTADGRLIELGAAARAGDEEHWQGQPHDFLGVDEATQFAESQIRYLMGWVRSTDPQQRCRVVLASNPPLVAEGLWVVEMFAPWLDDTFPNPAEPGELRWVVTDEQGKDKWVDGPEPVMIGGKLVTPLSRTFIPGTVADNPYLKDTAYRAQLDALPEPLRSAIRDGRFTLMLRDAQNQVIPTAWIRAAIGRWTEKPPAGIPMCAIGVDVAAGGEDETVLAIRYDGWYAPLIAVPGKKTPTGADVAGLVLTRRRDGAGVVIDMGGGYGGAVFEHLRANEIECIGYKGAAASTRRTADGQLKFTNKRSEAWWKLREALDPGQPGGSPIMLPDDAKVIGDLAAPTFEVTPNGIKVEPKEAVCARLGRSTDRGDAIVMAWSSGAKMINSALEWAESREMGGRARRRPQVVMSYMPISNRQRR